jgi:hypothetical protein
MACMSNTKKSRPISSSPFEKLPELLAARAGNKSVLKEFLKVATL